MGRSSLFLILAVLLIRLTTQPLADIAPPDWPPGANVSPESEDTQVRMESELVVIDVEDNIPEGSLGTAKVRASFWMRNLGPEIEAMSVRFPLTFWNAFSSSGNFPEIQDVQFFVAGETLDYRRVEIPIEGGGTLPWAEFGVTFPPDQEVLIEVAYTARPVGEFPFVAYRYVLETGAGWKGSIGEADIIVSLPYEANKQNVIMDTTTGWSTTTDGIMLDGNEVSWHFENFEPTSRDNIEVSLVMPNAWKSVLLERDRIIENPEDGEAWGRLGKAYKEISFLRRTYREDEGGQELYRLSVEAYENALELLPDDALWHAGFAELLFTHAYWDVFTPGSPNLDEMLRAIEEIKTAYDLRPDDPKVLEILASFSSGLPSGIERNGDGYNFLILTQTPTIVPTFTAEVTPSATELPATPTQEKTTSDKDDVQIIPEPVQTITPTASVEAEVTSSQMQGDSTLPFCGNILVIVPIGLFIIINRRKRSTWS